MAPEVDLGWGDPPKDPEGPAPAPPNPEPAGPEPGEYRYDDTIAASDGVKKGFLSTALGAAGKMIKGASGWLLYDGVEIVVVHWRLIVVGLAALGLFALQRTGMAKADPLFLTVAGVLTTIWVAAHYLWSGPEEEDEEGEPKPRKRPKLTKEERQTRREARLAFWGTESHPFPKKEKKSLVGQVGGFFTSGALLIGGIALMACVALWELGAKIFARPVDKTRPYGDRRPNWVVIGVLCALVPLSVLAGMKLPGAWDARGKMLAGMSLPALPKLPEFRWPTWGGEKPQVAQLPAASPTPKSPLAFGNGFKRKPDPDATAAAPSGSRIKSGMTGGATSIQVAAAPPAPAAAPPPVAAPAPAPTQQPTVRQPRPTKSVAQIKREVRQVEREIPAFTRQVKRELAALEKERKAAAAKANTAKKLTSTPRPTTMALVPPAGKVHGTPQKGATDQPATELEKLRAQLVARTKERDEARQAVKVAAAKPLPTPITVIKTATVSVPGPTRIVERRVPGPVRIVHQVQEVRVKVPVIKTVTKTRTVTRTVRVAGPTRIRVVDRPVTRTVVRTVTKTVHVPVLSPPRVVYRDRTVAAPKQNAGSRIKSGMTNAARQKVVVQAQQPVAQQTTTTRSSDPYGGDPYDY